MKPKLVCLAVLTAAALAALPTQAERSDAPAPGPALALVRAATLDQQRLLSGFDLAEHRHGDEIGVVLWPGDAAKLDELGFSYRITVPDLDAAARANGAGEWKLEEAGSRTTYRRLADYEIELRALATAYPDRAKLITGAHKTLEGRDVLGLLIASEVERVDGRPTSFVMGTHHSREWPAAELSMDLAHHLVKSEDARTRAIRDSVRTVLIPIVNPDGFNHSREALIDENLEYVTYFGGLVAGGQGTYWRKNRRGVAHVHEGHASVGSYGVDPNRNYAYQWGSGSLTGGSRASSNPTDATYQGSEPFSEPETKNVRQIVLTNNVTTLLTNHTFGDLVLWPWGHKVDPAPDNALLVELGTAMANSNGARGGPGISLYPTTGTTEDWSYAATGGLGYTFELGPDEFHPRYLSNIPQLYNRYRDSFLKLIEAAANHTYHSILTGSVRDGSGSPLSAQLRLTKTSNTPLWPGLGAGKTYTDAIDISMETGPLGTFAWHINPSTRPIATATESYTLTITAPGHAPVTRTVTVARGQTLSLGTITL